MRRIEKSGARRSRPVRATGTTRQMRRGVEWRNYLFPFARLRVLQSIWQLEMSIAPPITKRLKNGLFAGSVPASHPLAEPME